MLVARSIFPRASIGGRRAWTFAATIGRAITAQFLARLRLAYLCLVGEHNDRVGMLACNSNIHGYTYGSEG